MLIPKLISWCYNCEKRVAMSDQIAVRLNSVPLEIRRNAFINRYVILFGNINGTLGRAID